MTMKLKGDAIIMDARKHAVIQSIDFPEVNDETIVVKTKRSGVSFGTDMSLYEEQAFPASNLSYPLVPSYEEVGEVIYVGEKAPWKNGDKPFKVGDRVMANEVRHYPGLCAAWGGSAAYAVKNLYTAPAPMDEVVAIPDNVSYEEAVVAYLGTVALKGVQMVGVNAGETVMVTGCGCVGLSAMQLARIYGAKRIIAADIHANRLAHAEKYADALIDLSKTENAAEAVKQACGGGLADVVIECSGNPDAVNPLADYVRYGGRVHLQGQYRAPITITEYQRWNCSDLRISCSIATNKGCKAEVLRYISEGKFDAKLWDEVVDYHRAPEIYAKIEADRYKYLKFIFKWED
jgi:L-iditol 2-dehydrogenase